jgi:hypothetical protein
MSLARCELCRCIVDTDNEPESYVQEYADGTEQACECRCCDCRNTVYQNNEQTGMK